MKAAAVAIVIALFAAMLLVIQHMRLEQVKADLKEQVETTGRATQANEAQQKAIDRLQEEFERAAQYYGDLAKRIELSEAKAAKASKEFEDLKRNSPAVRSWADQPIPDELRKTPGGGK